MKNMQLVQEEEEEEEEEEEAAAGEEAARWKRLVCLKELSGIQKLRRKKKERRRQKKGAAQPPPPPPQQQQQRRAPTAAPEEEEEEALDLRRSQPCSQPFLSSRGVGGPLPHPHPPHPPPQGSYPSPAPLLLPPPHAPAALYRSRPREAPLSPPRQHPSAAPSEMKALQQTRRLLANARERTRVHTISAAFEALRKQVPCYSYGQKLSKLAILRIACNYILSLARLADLDYSADHSNMSFSECVEQCTRTLQAEGRSKKRKE